MQKFGMGGGDYKDTTTLTSIALVIPDSICTIWFKVNISEVVAYRCCWGMHGCMDSEGAASPTAYKPPPQLSLPRRNFPVSGGGEKNVPWS